MGIRNAGTVSLNNTHSVNTTVNQPTGIPNRMAQSPRGLSPRPHQGGTGSDHRRSREASGTAHHDSWGHDKWTGTITVGERLTASSFCASVVLRTGGGCGAGWGERGKGLGVGGQGGGCAPVDAAAVLGAGVAPLAHPLGGVVGLPELPQEVREGHRRRVVHHLHRLVVPRRGRARRQSRNCGGCRSGSLPSLTCCYPCH